MLARAVVRLGRSGRARLSGCGGAFLPLFAPSSRLPVDAPVLLTCSRLAAPLPAQVVAVGPGREEDGKSVKPKVDVGATVLYSKYSGTEVGAGEGLEDGACFLWALAAEGWGSTAAKAWLLAPAVEALRR